MGKAEKTQTSIEFNQSWINKAIENGDYQFLPSKKIPGLSIGEYIEARYEARRIIQHKKYVKRMREKYYGI